MRISSTHDVALAFLLALSSEKTPMAKAASITGVSTDHLEKVARKLRNAGLISSYHGYGGGFVLNRPHSQITVGDIFSAIGTETKRRGHGLFDEINRRLKNVALSELAAGYARPKQ
ncbi:Rrf2 family transcriptional regulator [Klebsiella sp. Ap-873]|nr:Rrf2 family transcriptional regulator [Klebsiella sp. Ap-873]